MPNLYLPYINIALDSFALLVTVVIFATCLTERSYKSHDGKYFLYFMTAISIALIFDIISWACEGTISLSYLIIISRTVASCVAQASILIFMCYLKETISEGSRSTEYILKIFSILYLISVLFSVGNAIFGYTFALDGNGHYVHTGNVLFGILYLLFPFLAFIAIVIMAATAKGTSKANRIIFIFYTIFPLAGFILDSVIHGLSLTYVGLSITVLVIYTNIYIKKQKLIENQQNALMLSQINPHFIYNTLSTIAAMCDMAPNQAKYLTLDFSKYLRQNLSSLSNENLISFEQEINHVECYLKIEKARFRERLSVIYSIQCKDFEIPPLSLQPLVENAVKHGITKKNAGGTVKISTYQTDTSYIIEVIDDGVGFDSENPISDHKTHVGLENVSRRIFDKCHGTVNVKSTPGVGTRVTIAIPKTKGKRK